MGKQTWEPMQGYLNELYRKFGNISRCTLPGPALSIACNSVHQCSMLSSCIVGWHTVSKIIGAPYLNHSFSLARGTRNSSSTELAR